MDPHEHSSAWTRVKQAMRREWRDQVTGQPPARPAKEPDREWNDMKPSRPWAAARDFVRHGWQWSRRKD